jgi:hypothetical protein
LCSERFFEHEGEVDADVDDDSDSDDDEYSTIKVFAYREEDEDEDDGFMDKKKPEDSGAVLCNKCDINCGAWMKKHGWRAIEWKSENEQKEDQFCFARISFDFEWDSPHHKAWYQKNEWLVSLYKRVVKRTQEEGEAHQKKALEHIKSTLCAECTSPSSTCGLCLQGLEKYARIIEDAYVGCECYRLHWNQACDGGCEKFYDMVCRCSRDRYRYMKRY